MWHDRYTIETLAKGSDSPAIPFLFQLNEIEVTFYKIALPWFIFIYVVYFWEFMENKEITRKYVTIRRTKYAPRLPELHMCKYRIISHVFYIFQTLPYPCPLFEVALCFGIYVK